MVREMQVTRARHDALACCLLLLAALLIVMLAGCPSPLPGGGPAGGAGGGPGPRLYFAPIEPSRIERDPITGLSVVGNEVLVAGDPGQAATIARDFGLRLVGSMPDLGLMQFRLTGSGTFAEARAIADRLRSRPGVEAVTFNWVRVPQAVYPDEGDGFAPMNWQADPPRDKPWGLALVKAPVAWNITEGDPSVQIGIIDGGFHKSHPDLSGRVKVYKSIGKTTHVADSPHGTHVAGIAAASQNGFCAVGIAHKCSLRLYDVGTSSITTTMQTDALRMAVDDGCRVVNMSLGTVWDHEPGGLSDNLARKRDELWWRRALSHAAHKRPRDAKGPGTVLVQSAGNGVNNRGEPPIDAIWNSPAGLEQEFDNYIVVAACDRQARLSKYSNYGKCVTVAAPGGKGTGGEEDVWSCWWDDKAKPGSQATGQFMPGTSMAAPFVAGLAALVLSLDPTLSAAEVKQAIKEGAQKGGKSLDQGNFYIINAAETLRAVAARKAGPGSGVPDLSGHWEGEAKQRPDGRSYQDRMVAVQSRDQIYYVYRRQSTGLWGGDYIVFAERSVLDDFLGDHLRSGRPASHILEQRGSWEWAIREDIRLSEDQDTISREEDFTGGRHISGSLTRTARLADFPPVETVQHQQKGLVRAGEERDGGSVTLERAIPYLRVILNYPGSKLVLRAIAPGGETVDEDSPSVTYLDDIPAQLYIRNPQRGTWNFRVLGLEVEADAEPFWVISTFADVGPHGERPLGGGGAPIRSGADPLHLAVVGAAAVVLLLLAAVVAKRQRRRPVAAAPVWRLVIREPGSPSRVVEVRSRSLRIGRGPGNHVVLADAEVSAVHLQLEWHPAGWVAYDLNSANSTFVEGRRLPAPQVVPPGARLRLGRTLITPYR